MVKAQDPSGQDFGDFGEWIGVSSGFHESDAAQRQSSSGIHEVSSTYLLTTLLRGKLTEVVRLFSQVVKRRLPSLLPVVGVFGHG